jgi:hypothetical protein
MEGGGQDLPSCIAGITLLSHAPHGRHRADAHRLRHASAHRGAAGACARIGRRSEIHGAERCAAPERQRVASARARSLRFLVKLAVRCQSAQELGKKLRRRYQRQQQRQGIETSRTAAAAAS